VGQLADRLRRNTGHPLALLEAPRLDRGLELLVAGGGVLDEGLVGQPSVDDLARDRVGQRDVGADVEPEPGVGPLRGAGPPRVDGVQPRPAMDSLEEVMEEDRMRVARVRSPQDQEIRFFDLLIGRRSAARTERSRQTDDAGSVSGAVARVDVV
jgi:hypothetical protein